MANAVRKTFNPSGTRLPRNLRIPSVKQFKQENRKYGTTESCNDWQRCFFYRAQFPEHNFPFYLKADDKEEDGHQAVIDPEDKRFIQFKIEDSDAEMFFPKLEVCLLEWRICKDESEYSGT